jgi:LacI family repressor for deo operon, udp, cdd, tsx, nupC, and nupG
VEFSAIFAQNDRIAVGAIRALRETGLRVPEDISVIGFDDMPLASYFDPGLTTIRQDTFNMGREAARLLIRAIETPEKQRRHLRMPVELVIRKSTAICCKSS